MSRTLVIVVAFTWAAALFRCGMLLGALPSGHAQLPDGLSECSLWHGHTSATSASARHAKCLPRLACPLLAVTSDGDAVWPAELVERWADVPPRGSFLGVKRLRGVPHEKLMNDAETIACVIAEVARTWGRGASRLT